MDKETLSNYGWVVIVIIILVIMIALASPFGGYISEAVMNSTEALNAKQESVFEQVGIEPASAPKIVANKSSSGFVDTKNKYLYGIEPETLDINKYFTAKNGYNLVWDKGTNQYYGTGTKVSIQTAEGKEVDKYTLILFGDVDNDGRITLPDFGRVDQYINGTTDSIEGAENLFAADMNADGIIDVYDKDIIDAYSMNAKSELSQNPYKTKFLNKDSNLIVDADRNVLYGFGPNQNNVDTQYFVLKGYTFNIEKAKKGPFYGTGSKVTVMNQFNDITETDYLVVFGDVDCDGDITMSDYADVGNGIPENAPTYVKIAADVNFDGEINSTDANLIKDCVTGGTLPQVPSK